MEVAAGWMQNFQQNTPFCGILGRRNLGTVIVKRSVLVMVELALTGAAGK